VSSSVIVAKLHEATLSDVNTCEARIDNRGEKRILDDARARRPEGMNFINRKLIRR